MVFPTVVLLVAVVVIALGAAAELTQAVRLRREPAGAPQSTAVQAVLDELDPRPFLVWFGIAALAVLAPGLLADTSLAPGELGLAVVVLGLAGERGQYLARLAGTQGGRIGGSAVLGALTVLGGVVVGAS